MAIDFQPKNMINGPFNRKRLVYRGAHRTLYEATDPGMLILHFQDNLKECQGIGVISNRLQEVLMSRLSEMGIDTHFVRRLNMREQLVRVSEPLPFSIRVHMVALGELAVALGMEDGIALPKPIVEYWTKSKNDCSHRIAFEHAQALDWLDIEEHDEIIKMVMRINDFLQGYFWGLNMRLANYNLRIGRCLQQDFWDSCQFALLDVLNFQKSVIVDTKTSIVMNEFLGFPRDSKTSGPKILSGYQEIARRFNIIECTEDDDQGEGEESQESKETGEVIAMVGPDKQGEKNGD